MARLWHHPTSADARAARIVLSEMGVAPDLVEEKTWEWRPEFLALNPAGTVPVLQVDEGYLVVGIASIVEHLVEEPTQPSRGIRTCPLLPATRPARAEARRLFEWFQHKFDHDVTRGLLHEKLLARVTGNANHAPDPALIRDLNQNLRYHLRYISHLASRARWLGGEDLSAADFMAAAHISTVDYLGEIDWASVPEAKRWYQQIKSRPSVRALLTDRWPGLAPADVYAKLDF
jgi:glutathione S-transferase